MTATRWLALIACAAVSACQAASTDAEICELEVEVVCQDDATRWLDSCGNPGEVIATCECGCNANGDDCAACVDLCENVTCDSPPPPVCIDEGMLRTYEAAGTCADGSCTYAHVDTSCTECCYGAEINPTGDPIGGGVGYSDVLTSALADEVVDDRDSLLAALAAAGAGEVIYIDDAAEIDLTGHDEITLPAGVTLASGRGRDGSHGALLWTSQFDTFPLFITGGDGVRVTGLRIRGPDPDVGDHDYQNPELSRGVQTEHADLEVDNCELSGFGHAAVVVYGEGAIAHVHHCSIHNNARAGLGYGVVLNQSHALIEANLFDSNRHSIAGTGRPGTSYEARYNIVLPHATSHYFDMHGAADFDKYITSAIWRFDEGTGSLTRDTSVFHSNDCTPTDMDMADAWVAGQIGTALRFDGIDDHLECGSDASLQSAEGSVELWLQTDLFDQNMDLFNLFENGFQDFLLIRRNAANKVLVVIEDDDVTLVSSSSDQTLTDTGWHHVVVTQDGTGVEIYIDGVLGTTTGTNSGGWSDHLALSGLWLGGGHWSNLDGVLDEVRLYSRALTADEVQLHFEGKADIAGSAISIHHNTFYGAEQSAIVIRGVPGEVAPIDHNWFLDTDAAHAIRQTNAVGNLDIQLNHFGSSTPLGTNLPVARFTATPSAGSAGVSVSFDAADSSQAEAGNEIAAWRWRFGDGSSGDGVTAQHTFNDPGAYQVELTAVDQRGALAQQLRPVTVAPPTGHRLDFWIKDSYRGALESFYVKQALIDGEVVWQDDVAGDEGWTHVSVDVAAQVADRAQVDLTFRALNLTAVSNEELIELSVYVDDVTLFGAEVAGGSFEASSLWDYSEGSSDWSGAIRSEEVRSGVGAYRLHHPYKRDCPAGSFAQIEQTVSTQ